MRQAEKDEGAEKRRKKSKGNAADVVDDCAVIGSASLHLALQSSGENRRHSGMVLITLTHGRRMPRRG